MKNKPAEQPRGNRGAPAALLMGLAVLAVAGNSGCLRPRSSVEFTSYKDPHFPERYTLDFEECVSRTDSTGDYRIVARTTRNRADSAAEKNGTSATASSPQYLDIHVFWRPTPGKTASDSSSMDATLRFVVASPRGVAVYRGTGFVYIKKDKWTRRQIATLESGRMRVDSISGSPPEVLGDCNVSARLVAKEDGNRAIDLLREIELTNAPR